jgi:hypothetical protein
MIRICRHDTIGELNPLWRRLVIAVYSGWSLFACILARRIVNESVRPSGTLDSSGKVLFAIMGHTFPIFVFLIISLVLVSIALAWSEWHYRRMQVYGVGIGIVVGVFLTGCSDRETTAGSACFDRDVAHLDVRSVDLFGYSTEGGVARYYHQGDLVEMIDATFYGEIGYSRTQFHRDGRGLLVCDSNILFARPSYLEEGLDPEISRQEVQTLEFADLSEIPDSSELGRLYGELIRIFESGVDELAR